MKIAVLGIRGIPANYGGFETFAEELAPRLVRRGHRVTVYGRANTIRFRGRYYKGVRIRILPTIPHKYLDTVVHTLLCVIHAVIVRYDVILICNAANSIFAWIPRLAGIRVVVNVDGIERLRGKWNRAGRLWYRLGEIFSVLFPNQMVSDASVIQKYYLETYGKGSIMIPYGASTEKETGRETLDRFGLDPDGYILYVSRLEPENNAHLVIQAYEKVKTDRKLVIVGDAPYARDYIASLKKTSDPRILFTGYVFGRGYRELQSHAFCYVHATEVGGTHPALIEAMGFGNCVIANGTVENREVLGGTGLIYPVNDVDALRRTLQRVTDEPGLIPEYQRQARRRIEGHYSWNTVADSYEKLFDRLRTNRSR